MEKTVRIARSFEEADRVDREYYRRLTPEQRLEILFELNRRLRASGDHGDTEGFKRVYRITKFESG